MKRELTKAQRKKLRVLAELAHERDLSRELGNLEEAFRLWRKSDIDPFELSDRIHLFHDGPSRKLYSFYRDARPDFAVAAAIARGTIGEQEAGPELMALLQTTIDSIRGQLSIEQPSA